MSIEQIKDILKGDFADEADRKYWQDKLADLEHKERSAEENEGFYKEMRAYDR